MVGSFVQFFFTRCVESLNSLVRASRNSWRKIVRTHQPWSNLYVCMRYKCSRHKNDKISSHVKIWYLHMWRYRWFRWYHVCLLNCTWFRWCIIETSSGLPRKSSAIFGNLRKFSGNVRNVRLAFGTILENLRKSSESGRTSSENHKRRRYQYAYIIKRT